MGDVSMSLRVAGLDAARTLGPRSQGHGLRFEKPPPRGAVRSPERRRAEPS